MDHNHYYGANEPYRLPSLLVRIRIGLGSGQRIVENKLSHFKAELVLALIVSILFRMPYPRQDSALITTEM